jgi:hypothetical protein
MFLFETALNNDMKWLLLLMLFVLQGVCVVTKVYSQAGTIGLGVRAAPDGGGFTARYFIDPNIAIEGQLNEGGVILGDKSKTVEVVGLVEYHLSLPNPALRTYAGAGLHAGTWDRGKGYSTGEGRKSMDTKDAIFGIDGIAGIEYQFSKMPLAVSFDFKPAINFAPDVAMFSHNVLGLGAKLYIR